MLGEHRIRVGAHDVRVVSRLGAEASEALPLLLFNGIGAAAEVLTPLLEAFPGPLLTYDLPGVGQSRAAVPPLTMRGHAEIAQSVLTSFGVSRCHVMGISWGGSLAQQFALQFPERTAALVLAATSTGVFSFPPRPSVLLRMSTPARYYSRRLMRRLAGELYGGDFRTGAGLLDAHLERLTAPPLIGYGAQLLAMAFWTSAWSLHRIKAPTLVMAGVDDPIVPLANARYLASGIPGARLSTYDCGHLFVLTRLPRVVAEVQAFLDAAATHYTSPA